MTNPQDNPGNPTPPTPSNSSTPPPPSTSPKPRLRRVKMLARKTVASGALTKKLNARQDQDYDSNSNFESYKSAKRLEESGNKSRGSGSGEAAEGMVNLSTQGDEPGSSTEETLADLLKKVGGSYDPKKQRTPTPKAPSIPKPSKKRKALSPTTTEFSLPKGRATRSKVKQSESDLQKALAESKKKKLAKGKGKATKSLEVVEVEKMEQVHQEEVQPVEVQTLKPKKPKISSKKSSSVSEAVEPSLAKRTRFAVKSKQVKISEDKEWSGE
uniref:Ena/VASP-like protein n=1 Tax=Nicotiana sylvestris TaxID=4096 RepID=A0A1U7XDN8_NICSY|nr:PREDICTED: ena/VASP-like protein [Nicotiana sylvestris]